MIDNTSRPPGKHPERGEAHIRLVGGVHYRVTCLGWHVEQKGTYGIAAEARKRGVAWDTLTTNENGVWVVWAIGEKADVKHLGTQTGRMPRPEGA